MRRTLRRIERAAKLLGVDVRRGLDSARRLGRFAAQHREFVRRLGALTDAFPVVRLDPFLGEDEGESGTAGGHYFHQDLYVAQRIYSARPRRHVDIGSRVDGFVGHVASFREIEVFDIRPLRTSARGIKFTQCDAMQKDAFPPAYADSVSCLHALEHFGLGRYGDRLDPLGHVLGLGNLARLLEPQGTLYLSVPIGPQRVEFNGQRIFSVGYLLELAREHGLALRALSYVDDAGELHPEVTIGADDIAKSFGCEYGCGIFELGKT